MSRIGTELVSLRRLINIALISTYLPSGGRTFGKPVARTGDGETGRNGVKRRTQSPPEQPKAAVRRDRAGKLGISSGSWWMFSSAIIDTRTGLPRLSIGKFVRFCGGGTRMGGVVIQDYHRPLQPTAGSCVQQVHSSPPSALAWWFPNRWEGSNFIRGTAACVCDDAVTGAGRSAGRCCPSGWVVPAGMAASTTSGSMHGTPILSWRSHWVEKPQYRRLSSRGGTATVRQPTMPRHLLLLFLCLFSPCCGRHAASQTIPCDPRTPALI